MSLNASLKKSGMLRAFSNGQFSKIGKSIEAIFLAEVMQKSKVELDENGVIAAAVTAVMGGEAAVRQHLSLMAYLLPMFHSSWLFVND